MSYSKRDIDRFFDGKLSKKEAKDFLNWLDSPAGESTYNAIIEDAWSDELKNTDEAPEKADPHIFVFSKKENQSKNISSSPVKNSKYKSKTIWTLTGLAATLVLLLSASYIFYFDSPSHKTEERTAFLEVKTIERFTPKGNKKIITLPDGSTVVLNADSKLTYASDFIQNRTITLEGEGFFDVVRDEEHPFKVITDNIATTALGTSFNIRAYEGNPNIQISLASGKVKVENNIDQNLLEITPGEAVYYSEDSNTFEKQNVNLSHVLSWKEGILQFEKTPFNLIIEDLERWYGVEIKVTGDKKLPEYKCSGTFKPHEYLSNVLKVLSYSVEFEYKISGNEVTLEFN
ncbi:FecR family protein [Aquiflexum gelatinilyticum]|uniref:DUF4974 domain-containing protein n=1 Tax=Aquiflexum gelatinilyticum TaxID=2961943 RepID=A0A9X2P8C3_9BACT|nr:FecR domain-containing protein [Aquiflexum gelatinilyticum]MCR9015267.1 DUF4974 domain-containing protein [Aquiflexum gelatinilyticum]